MRVLERLGESSGSSQTLLGLGVSSVSYDLPRPLGRFESNPGGLLDGVLPSRQFRFRTQLLELPVRHLDVEPALHRLVQDDLYVAVGPPGECGEVSNRLSIRTLHVAEPAHAVDE